MRLTFCLTCLNLSTLLCRNYQLILHDCLNIWRSSIGTVISKPLLPISFRYTKGLVSAFHTFSNVLQYLKNGPTPASFSFIFVLSNTHYNFNNKYMLSLYCKATKLLPRTVDVLSILVLLRRSYVPLCLSCSFR